VGYIKKEISALLAKVGGSVTNSELERLLNLDVFEDRYLREAACEVVGDELSIRFPGSVKTPVGKVGWNYNWNSQRFLAQTKHVFTSYLLTKGEGDVWNCKCALNSRTFEVESLRSFKKRQQEIKNKQSTDLLPSCLEISPKRVKMSPENLPGSQSSPSIPMFPRNATPAPLAQVSQLQQPSLIQRQQQTVGAMDNLISIFENLSFDQSHLDTFVQSLLTTSLAGSEEGGDFERKAGNNTACTAFAMSVVGDGYDENSKVSSEMEEAICTHFVWADTRFNIHERQRIEDLFWEIKSSSGPAFKSFASEVDTFVEHNSDFLSHAFTVVNQKDLDSTMHAQLSTLYQSFVNLSMQHISQKWSASDGAGQSESMVQKLSEAMRARQMESHASVESGTDGGCIYRSSHAADAGANLSFLAFIAEVSQQTNRGGLYSGDMETEPIPYDEYGNTQEFFENGIWDFTTISSNSGKMDEFLKACYFPWLIRKLTLYVVSKVRISVTADHVEMTYRSVFSTHASSHARRETSLNSGSWPKWKYTEVPRIETDSFLETHKLNVLFTRAMIVKNVIRVQVLRATFSDQSFSWTKSVLNMMKSDNSRTSGLSIEEWFAKVRTTDVDETGLPNGLNKKAWLLVCEDWKQDDEDPSCNALDIHAYSFSEETGYWTESHAKTSLKCPRAKNTVM
jgi:hypothetical protein